MPEDYIVQQGDCIGSIAYTHGFFWETLWNDNANSDLKSKRKDPNILMEGDVVHIPDLTLKEQAGGTEKKHKFKLKGVPARLQLQLLEAGKPESSASAQSGAGDAQVRNADSQAKPRKSKPRADVPYIIEIDGALKRGRSDGEGFIKMRLPPDAQRGCLRLFPGTPKEERYPLKLGEMDPVAEITGIRKRLRNLGIACDTGNEATPEFEAALITFQERVGLNATGKPDDATRNALKKTHGG